MAVQWKKKKLGELLLEAGVVTEQDLEKAFLEQKKNKKRLGEILAGNSICTQEQIAMALSSQLGLEYIDLKITPIEPDAVKILPERWARKHQLIAMSIHNRDLRVAMSDPLDLLALQDTEFVSGYKIKPFVTTINDINWAINKHYHLAVSLSEIVEDMTPAVSGTNDALVILNDNMDEHVDVKDVRRQSEEAPIIRIVSNMLVRATIEKASDIHIEPMRDKVVVRVRVDGYLRLLSTLPKWAQGAVVSRIKVMAKLDIAEKRVPQDGRIGIKISEGKLDLRISTMPTNYGEKIVIRILDPTNSLISVEQLGLDNQNLKIFSSLISRPQGIILVTGPTGSGKTTTLYAALSRIKGVEKNITTIEDPVEYDLEDINQVSVNEKVGRTFSNLLRSVLRQDPDVILVGEMRDQDTAMVAMQASLTGHLVLSTIHTNDTVSTITRIRNLGIPSYLIASTVIGIVAQRLVRVICPFCKEVDVPANDDLRRIGYREQGDSSVTFYKGKGCGECGNTGYKGRTGLYEMLPITQRLKEYISNEATETTIRQLALAEGLTTLIDSGLEKVLSGVISVDGVLRVSSNDELYGTLCSSCGNHISTEFIACPHCRNDLIKTCPECRKIVDPKWKFCPYCTHALSEPGPLKQKVAVYRQGKKARQSAA